MVAPRVAKKGKSFKGAGLYYLHDKKASTSERVVFTLTLNLPTDDPEKALRFMAFTAMRQGELKAANDGARTGRKLTYPVYHYSLAWHPEQNPAQDEMISAAIESLQFQGLEEHEVLLVAHDDTPHPHIHVIVNRVHPRTGIAHTHSLDFNKFSEWAEAYEYREGKIRCPQRVINNERRRRGEFVKYRPDIDKAAFHQWRKAKLTAAYAVRRAEAANLSAYHSGQRKALFDERERRINQRGIEIREKYRPLWAGLYKMQEIEAKELHRAQKGAFSRLMHWIRHRDEAPQKGLLRGALEAVLGRHDYAAALWKKQEQTRKELADYIAAERREAIEQENVRYESQLEILKHEQAEQTQAKQDQHTQDSQDLARGIKEGAGEEQFRREEAARLHAEEESRKQEAEYERAEERAKPVRDQFRDRVAKRIRKAKKRDEKGKDKNAGRERED